MRNTIGKRMPADTTNIIMRTLERHVLLHVALSHGVSLKDSEGKKSAK